MLTRKHKTIKPRHLRESSTVGVVTPSEPVTPEMFEQGLDYMCSLGLTPKLGAHVFDNKGHLAGTDADRASDIMTMFTDEAVDAIFCSAGGANSARLLPLLDYDAIKSHPKIFIGMSDPTALLCGIYAKTGLVTFHGPVVQYDMSWHCSPFTEKYFRPALFDARPGGIIPEVTEANILRLGTASGRLVGGNLSTLQQLIGTPYEPDWEGAILFWEDVCEQPHTLDAKLTHLRNAGVFDRLAGMIVGVLEECVESDYENVLPIREIVLELTEGARFPILHEVPLGHTKDKITLPIGANASIGASGTVLSIEESGVA